jgi:hypothetical protein
VGCPRLFIQFIRCYPLYRRPFLHPQLEDAPCRGDREPLLKYLIYNFFCVRTFPIPFLAAHSRNFAARYCAEAHPLRTPAPGTVSSFFSFPGSILVAAYIHLQFYSSLYLNFNNLFNRQFLHKCDQSCLPYFFILYAG